MTSPRYEIRAATRADKDEILELARFLDSVNLPNHEPTILEILEHSEQSFSGEIGDPRRRNYVFVLRDLEQKRAVGTSMVIAQLGRKDAPYIYFDVHVEERYSATLDKHFAHPVLSIGYSFAGPTEIGGLVVHPEVRRSPERLGMLISYVRFLWISLHRTDFQDRVLAELLPPLEPDGTSHLWEAVGRRFTGLDYREADRLSKRNKEFIRGLFPDGDIYVSLLSPEARSVVGKVGPQTRGVEKLLRRIGFRYWNRVDPFDGGPHFVAGTDEILLVQRTRIAERHRSIDDPNAFVSAARALVAREHDGFPHFHAIPSLFVEASGEPGTVLLPAATCAHLGLSPTDRVVLLPLD
ncbi:MAG: arginine N-succinyltransferase [Myxococcota bacterium]|nr:arginine N-succinyltransferase [Myxococcota bacterium]